MRSRPARVLFVLAVAALVSGLTACTGGSGGADAPTVAELTKAKPSTVDVADQGDPAERAVATSRALFDRAPGVVVAPSADTDADPDANADADADPDADADAAQARAAALARRLHVPTLVVDEHDGDHDGDRVAAEIRRLHARWYVPLGGVQITTDARRTDPDDARGGTGPSRASRPTTVVVADETADVAACATAEAAGAHVVRMPDGVTDPAASPDVVRELAARKDAPTLLLGSAFSALGDPHWTVRAAETGYQLAHGGQRPFDGHRFVALYGAPSVPVLGVLGEQGPQQTVARARQTAAQYDGLSSTPVTPMLEVITTMSSGAPGADGDYSTEFDPSRLEPYLDAAHQAHMPVVLDLQPGRTDFLTQAKRYSSLLKRPDVWLALDPEWRLGPDQVPLRQIGTVSAAEVNSVSDWLSRLVRDNDLPPKALVLHQFRLSMLQDRSSIDTSHPELDVLVHVDGQGSQPDKQATWKALHQDAPAGVQWGWKNFIDEDKPMLTPAQTMAEVQPTPALITYQ